MIYAWIYFHFWNVEMCALMVLLTNACKRQSIKASYACFSENDNRFSLFVYELSLLMCVVIVEVSSCDIRVQTVYYYYKACINQFKTPSSKYRLG